MTVLVLKLVISEVLLVSRPPGLAGADGDGFTGGYYSPSTGRVYIRRWPQFFNN